MLAKAIFVPLGDQLEPESCTSLYVNLIGLLPSAAFMVYISWLPSLLLSKAIFVPLGDQLGNESHSVLYVNLVRLLPSAAFMVYMSPVTSLSLKKAIFVPSGDHLGSESHAGLFVNLIGLLPSAAFMVYISWFAMFPSSVLSLLVLKAIFVPSGDQLGLESSARLSVSRVNPLPSAFMTYMLLFPSLSLSKAIFV